MKVVLATVGPPYITTMLRGTQIAAQPISNSQKLMEIGEILNQELWFILNHNSTLRAIGVHYQNVCRIATNIELHTSLVNHPNEDVIGIVDCGLLPDHPFDAKQGVFGFKYLY